MRALSDAELLMVWERGLVQRPAYRALDLLVAACPETPPDDLARLSVGRRDASLLALREKTFGSKLVSLASCPACGQPTELAFEISQVLIAPLGGAEGPFELSVGGCCVRFRLPDTRDLEAVEQTTTVDDARATLLARCLLSAERDGEPLEPENLPAEVSLAMERCMAEADPQADVRLVCGCPQCDETWQAQFDIVSFMWLEICAWAKRTLREIHVLASAYGWREADILALGPFRREVYLELVGE